MSKAAGATGGFIAAPVPVTQYLINNARAFIYTTAPSPVNAAVCLAALEMIKDQPERRTRLKQNSDYLRNELKKIGFDTGNSNYHIIPVILGSEKKALHFANKLYDKGFFIPAIRPPTVAKGTSRLRISLQADHTKKHIDALVKALKNIAANYPAASAMK